MIITVDAAAEIPPYAQVRSQLLDAIATGALQPGTRLPTIRQLAGDLGLANNTVARAYRELLADGVLESRGRRGTFVRDQATDVVPDARTQRLEELVRTYVDGARSIGVPSDEIVGALDRALGS
ncbi:GntR family transcriptional regulator [Candidatus Microthrix sp.]|uniref:GntR family transcriptional regulator n=1 Tax=Candidatus Neomicrothrix sp. TaxID=2719034 RepID=UPI002A4E2302|nr:GntR family transcriptional regulator [Candidatus Microthrix sp.]